MPIVSLAYRCAVAAEVSKNCAMSSSVGELFTGGNVVSGIVSFGMVIQWVSVGVHRRLNGRSSEGASMQRLPLRRNRSSRAASGTSFAVQFAVTMVYRP